MTDPKIVEPRICLGCGEWFDPVGAEKVCVLPGCRARATIIGKQAADHAAMVKRNYTADWVTGDVLQMRAHANWRADHPPIREDRVEEPWRDEVIQAQLEAPNDRQWRALRAMQMDNQMDNLRLWRQAQPNPFFAEIEAAQPPPMPRAADIEAAAARMAGEGLRVRRRAPRAAPQNADEDDED